MALSNDQKEGENKIKTNKYLIVLPTLCLTMLLFLLVTIPAWAEGETENVINVNTTWSVLNEPGNCRWISKPTGDPQVEPGNLIGTGDDTAGIIAPVTIYEGKTLTIEMPMVSIPPLNIQSISSGDNNGGSVDIVQPATSAEADPAWGIQLSVNGIDGENSSGPTPAGDGGTAVKLEGGTDSGMTIDIYEKLQVTIQGGKGGSCPSSGAGGAGGTAVDCALTVGNGSVTVKGGEGGQSGAENNSGAPGAGVGTNGSVTLEGGKLTIEGGESKVISVAGGTGVKGTVTLAGGTLTVNGGKVANYGNSGPAFGEGAKVIIADGYAYTNGTMIYGPREYTTSDFDLNTNFGNKTLELCEAKVDKSETETFYATLKDAMDVAQDGDTVTLLKDVELNETIGLFDNDPENNTGKQITLDLNGKKITFTEVENSASGQMPFTYDESKMMTLEGSGTIEALGIGTSGNVVTLWRFSRDASGTGTLTIVNDVLNDKVTGRGNRPWEAFSDYINAVVMGDGVTTFTKIPFAYCKNLKTVTISASVTEGYNEEQSPFADCPNLEAINVDPDNPAFTNNDNDGVLYTKDKKTLLYCPRGKTGTFIVPAAVTKLAEHSFNQNDTVNNSVMQLSRIEFARTEAGAIAAGFAFNDYKGDCVLAAADGMFIESKSEVPAKDYTYGGNLMLRFRAVTPWDELQAALNKGGTVTLTRSYDYTKDSYEISRPMSTSYYGALDLPEDTVLDLNGYTLTADEVDGDGQFTVKGGTLNCGKLTNESMNHGTLNLIDATVTIDQGLSWNGGMNLMESDLTIGWGEEASDDGSTYVYWMPSEDNSPMLTMDPASSMTLPRQKMDDGTWSLLDYEIGEVTEHVKEQLSSFLPWNLNCDIVTGTRYDGNSTETRYALSVKDETGAFPASVTLRGCKVTGSFDGTGKLAAAFTAPKDCVLIAAAYESSGKMADMRSFAITEEKYGETHLFTDLNTGTDYTYKLMLADAASHAPLCPAWEFSIS